MIDIYRVPKRSRSPKKSIPFIEFMKYGASFLVLLTIIYFGLGFTNKQIDNWLKLEPINLKTSATTKDKKTDSITTNKTETAKEPASKETAKDKVPASPEANSVTPPAQESTTVQNFASLLKPEEPKVEAASTTTLEKSGISIRVLNGNALYGSAVKAKSVLEKDGFKVKSVGNADNQTYQSTVIYYKSDKKAQAELALKTLDPNYQVSTEENSTLVGSNDLLVVVGKK